MNAITIITDVDTNPPLKGVPLDKTVRIQAGIKVCRIPGGMDSGKSCVAITAPLPDGRHVMLEISMTNFQAAAHILKTADSTNKN